MEAQNSGLVLGFAVVLACQRGAEPSAGTSSASASAPLAVSSRAVLSGSARAIAAPAPAWIGIAQQATPGEGRAPAVRGGLALKLEKHVLDLSVSGEICVLDEERSVRCGTFKSPFRDVPLPERATALSPGETATCALLESGRVGCWGCTGTEGSPTTPAILALPRLRSLSVGQEVGCGVTLDDNVVCWGTLDYSTVRQRGDDVCNSGNQEIVAGTKNVVTVALSPETHVATAWFLGSDGRVGVREEFPQTEIMGSKVRMARRWRPALGTARAPERAVELQAAGRFEEQWFPRRHGCVLRYDGKVSCVFGAPDDVSVAGKYRNSFVHACALLGDGRVSCWGDDRSRQAPPLLAFPSPATALAIGSDHGCAILSDQTVSCWGAADGHALGGTAPACEDYCLRYASCSSTPRAVENLDKVTTLRAAANGALGTCAVTSDAWLVCFGDRDGETFSRRYCDRNQAWKQSPDTTYRRNFR